MKKIRTINLALWLPAGIISVFLCLFILHSYNNYQQQIDHIYEQGQSNLISTIWQLAGAIEYKIANNDHQEIRRDIASFNLKDNAEFSAFLTPDNIIEFASFFAWQGKPAQETIPALDVRLIEQARNSHKLVVNRNTHLITAIVPVADKHEQQNHHAHIASLLVLQINLERQLQQAFKDVSSDIIPFLVILFLTTLLLIWALQKSVIKPLHALQGLVSQFKQGDFNLHNPLSGNTEQTRVAQALVDAGHHIKQQLIDLADKEQRLSVTLHSIGDAVIVTDHLGKITRMNKAANELTGWQQDEAIGLDLPVVFDIYNASTGDAVANPVEQVLATKKTVELANHTVLVSKSGQRFHISDSAAPIRVADDESSPILGVILVFQNVTTQYHLREALKENIDFLENLLRVSPTVTYVLDVVNGEKPQFHLSYITDSIVRYTGETSETWLQSPSYWQTRVHPDDAIAVYHKLIEAIETKKTCINDFRIHHQDGHYITVRDHLTAVFDEQDNIIKIVGVAFDISAYKQTLEQNQVLGEILERSLNEIYVFDINTFKFTQVNKGARSNLGYSMEELLTLTPIDLKPEFSREEFEHLVEPLINGEKDRLEFETIHQRKDGSSYPVEIDLQIDCRGEQAVFVAIVDDITARKQIEQSLIKEKSLLRSIIDSTPDFIFCKDDEGVYLRCNKAVEELFGAKEAEIVGKTDFDFVDKTTAESFREQDKIMMDKGQTNINEETVIYPDGRRAILQTLKTPYKTASGEVLGLLGIARDITEQRKAEQELHIAGQVFAASNEGILVTDPDNNIIQVNPAFSEITGYNKEEVIGKNPRILSSGLQDHDFFHRFWTSLHASGSWSGEIWNRRKSGEVYPQWLSISIIKDSHGHIQQYIALMSDISKNKAAEERISWLAHHDVLTKLPNRALLQDRTHQALIAAERQQKKVALLFIDLDRFKFINDSLGHSIGDELLIEVAQRLLHEVREDDTVSRTGGDEFTVLLTNSDEQGAAHVAEKLIEKISHPFVIKGHHLYVTLSIGISLFPDNGRDAQILNQKADTAMYRAKENGRNQYQFFTEEMQSQLLNRLELEHALRFSVKHNELELVYQPQIDINTKTIIGAEALLRWKHPEKGYISPLEFIPIAEESGMITEIGQWVLDTAMIQLQQWMKAGYHELTVAVNLSAVQFNDPKLVENITTLKDKYHICSQNLELEITESVAMANVDLTIKQLEQLSKAGVQLSLDDFGTGYSSLSYLKKFPINKLKIDQSFIFDMLVDKDEEAIVDAIITLAQTLGLKTIAEGVEEKLQMDALQMKGCDQLQGYYFSKPIPAQQFSQLLESHKNS